LKTSSMTEGISLPCSMIGFSPFVENLSPYSIVYKIAKGQSKIAICSNENHVDERLAFTACRWYAKRRKYPIF